MVARGDLGVEVPAEDVPIYQKMMIKKCNEQGKPVITATQMLDSMQRNPRPTRAEVGDVANAIFDGTDAVMLSGETAAGKYPVESIKTMARIAERAEEVLSQRERSFNDQPTTITDAISQSVARTAIDLKVKAILTPTESGYTARMVSKYRPNAQIIAVTPHASVFRKLSLVWGVYPVRSDIADSTDEMLVTTVDAAVKSGKVNHGDLVVITAGVPVRESGTTNMMKVHIVGNVAAKGQGIGKQVVTGKVINVNNAEEANLKMEEGAVLITSATDKDMMEAFSKASAVITQEGGITSHAAVVGISLGIPVIVGVEKATSLFKDGQEVTVDSSRGHIYVGHAHVL
jgi:pyruvate kinase